MSGNKIDAGVCLSGRTCYGASKDGTPARRGKSSWYCDPCETEFRAEQDRRRGSGVVTSGVSGAVKPASGSGVKVTTKYADGTRAESTLGDRLFDRFDVSKALGSGHGHKPGTGAKIFGDGRPSCDRPHNGAAPVLTLPSGKLVYGARGSELHAGNVAHLGLIVDCAGMVKVPALPKFVKVCPPKYRRFAQSFRSYFPDVIRLDWPDMSAPVHVGIEFWAGLADAMPEHTCFACIGSHGRTGTAMAALLIATGMDPDLAIKTVREKHCRRAIETTGQETYLRGLRK